MLIIDVSGLVFSPPVTTATVCPVSESGDKLSSLNTRLSEPARSAGELTPASSRPSSLSIFQANFRLYLSLKILGGDTRGEREASLRLQEEPRPEGMQILQ